MVEGWCRWLSGTHSLPFNLSGCISSSCSEGQELTCAGQHLWPPAAA